MTASSAQHDLTGFHDAPETYRILATPDNSTAIYEVTLDPRQCRNIETGEPCDSFRFNGDCIHCQKAENRKIRAEYAHAVQVNEYLQTRYERRTKARFPDVERVMASFEDSCKPEIAYLSTLFLAMLYSGPATTDNLYEAVDGKFQANPRILGNITRSLCNQGLIRAGPIVRGTRQKDHYARKPVYMITEAGRRVITMIT